MPTIRNHYISLYCEPDGRGLILSDIRRGASWTLDEKTLVYELVQDKANASSTLLQMEPVHAQLADEQVLQVTCKAGSEGHVIYEYRLKPEYVEVTVDHSDLPDRLKAFSLPGSFVPLEETLQLVLPIMQGMLWKGQGDSFEWRLPENGHGGFVMPLTGYLGDRGGLLVTTETQDDAVLWVGKDKDSRYWGNYLQTASLGSIRYSRTANIYVTDANHVSIAKAYRNKIIAQDRFKSWQEKIAERPALERLFGSLMCFIGYCQDELDYAAECEKLKQFGFDKALVYPARFNTYHRDLLMGGLPAIDLSQEQVARIVELGYDVAPWSWINESLDDGTDFIHNRYRLSESGKYIPSWSIDEQQWNQICTSTMAEYVRAANENLFADMTWDHYDVITCATLGECHASDHPRHLGKSLSKTEDREFIRELLLAAHADGRAVSSEGFNDMYSTLYDLGSVKALPMFSNWPFWPIPLTSLVYHDSMIHSWWEVHNYNSHRFGRVNTEFKYEYGGGRPRIQAAMDALYGSPPDVFPFGSQYMWTGKGNETFAFRFRFEDPEVQHALREALPVAKLHEKIGKLEMINHRFLSKDGNVQETTFSDGTRVVANFASSQRGDVPGIDPLQAESWIVIPS